MDHEVAKRAGQLSCVLVEQGKNRFEVGISHLYTTIISEIAVENALVILVIVVVVVTRRGMVSPEMHTPLHLITLSHVSR